MAKMEILKNLRSKAYDPGRPYGAPNMIILHHWGVLGQKFDSVASYLCRPNGNTSAHYVVEEGRVAELVSPENRAWHCRGNNLRTIGIECRPECSEGDVRQVAELVVYLRRKYGNIPLGLHKTYVATDCPGRWASQIGKIEAYASSIEKKQERKLEVDGVAGPLTVKRLQEYLGTVADGVISSQDVKRKEILPSLVAVKYVKRPRGSEAVKALQRMLKVEEDGILGPVTVKALQAWLNNV